jgi:hypothetical protein
MRKAENLTETEPAPKKNLNEEKQVHTFSKHHSLLSVCGVNFKLHHDNDLEV